MATYVRAAGDHVAERVRPEPGSDEEAGLEQLAADPNSGWRIEDVEGAGPPELAPFRPSTGASKDAWIDWAICQGATREQVQALTKAKLIELYGGG